MMYMLFGDMDALYENLKLFSYLWHMLLHKISSHSKHNQSLPSLLLKGASLAQFHH